MRKDLEELFKLGFKRENLTKELKNKIEDIFKIQKRNYHVTVELNEDHIGVSISRQNNGELDLFFADSDIQSIVSLVEGEYWKVYEGTIGLYLEVF